MSSNFNPVVIQHGTCPDCKRTIRLSGHGRMWRHKADGSYCYGTNCLPVPGTVTMKPYGGAA